VNPNRHTSLPPAQGGPPTHGRPPFLLPSPGNGTGLREPDACPRAGTPAGTPYSSATVPTRMVDSSPVSRHRPRQGDGPGCGSRQRVDLRT
jgi:hypothetical protein